MRLFRFRLLDDSDFIGGEGVESASELVDLVVGGVDLALEGGFVEVGYGGAHDLVRDDLARRVLRTRVARRRAVILISAREV